MEKLNMANMSTLFRKGYLLAGVVMLLNMFVVKEVMAMEGGSTGNPFSSELQMNPNSNNELNNNSTNIEGYRRIEGTESEKLDVTEDQFAPSILDELLYRLLFWENRINFFGGIIVSGFNNYLKLWDYNPGVYRQFGCIGWRYKRSLYEVLQFEVNLNLIRGAFWLIPGIIGFIQYANGKEDPIILLRSTAGLITMKILSTNEEWEKKSKVSFGFGVSYFIFFILQVFISMPLTFHISNFSISISLDSMIWGITGFFLDKKFLKDNNNEGKSSKEKKN